VTLGLELGLGTYGLRLDDFRISGLELGVRGLGLAPTGLSNTSRMKHEISINNKKLLTIITL